MACPAIDLFPTATKTSRAALLQRTPAKARKWAPGNGNALVGDGGASPPDGPASGRAGLNLCGAVRDVAGLRLLNLGIKDLGTNPRRSTKGGTGTIDLPGAWSGATLVPGHWVYSDDDGIVTAPRPLHMGG